MSAVETEVWTWTLPPWDTTQKGLCLDYLEMLIETRHWGFIEAFYKVM